MCGIARRIAVAVAVVSAGTMRGSIFAAWRLRELPDQGVRNATPGSRRRIVWDNAAGRGWTSVVKNEVSKLTLADVVANIVGRNDADAVTLVYCDARAVGSGTIAATGEFIHPSSQVRVVICSQTASFFNIQKNDRV